MRYKSIDSAATVCVVAKRIIICHTNNYGELAKTATTNYAYICVRVEIGLTTV